MERIVVGASKIQEHKFAKDWINSKRLEVVNLLKLAIVVFTLLVISVQKDRIASGAFKINNAVIYRKCAQLLDQVSIKALDALVLFIQIVQVVMMPITANGVKILEHVQIFRTLILNA